MRVYALVVLLVLWSVGAAAEPSVARKSGPGFDIYTVSFDASTAETKLIQPGASCSVGVAYTGTGTVSLYQVATATTAAASGTLVGTFSASTTAPTTFRPGLPYLKAVASSTGTSGTLMTIRCSNTEIAGALPGQVGSEETLEYIFNMREFDPAAIAYEGGAKDFYFSQGTGGLLPVTGNDSNAGTRAAPMLSCAKMEEMVNAVDGARIWVDGADGDWTDAANCATLLNGIDISCDGSRGPCAVISALDPDNPWTIDATGATEDAFQCTSSTDGAVLMLQNIFVENLSNADAIDTDNDCDVIALNFGATVTGNGNDNVFTPHNDTDSTIWVLGDRSFGTIDASSTNTNFVFAPGAGTSHFGVISRGVFTNADDEAAQAVITVSGGGDGTVTMIGPQLISGASTSAAYVALQSPNSASPHNWYFARTTFVGASANDQLIRAVVNGADDYTTILGYQNSFVGNGIAFQIVTVAQEAGATFDYQFYDTLVDGMGGSIINHDGETDTGAFTFTLEGVFDEDDSANSWDIDSTLYATLVLAQAGYPDGWTIGTDSTYADLGGAGTECSHTEDDCASATVTLPIGQCHIARECYTQSVVGSYYLPIGAPKGLRFVVPGVTLTGFQLNRGQIGAR